MGVVDGAVGIDRDRPIGGTGGDDNRCIIDSTVHVRVVSRQVDVDRATLVHGRAVVHRVRRVVHRVDRDVHRGGVAQHRCAVIADLVGEAVAVVLAVVVGVDEGSVTVQRQAAVDGRGHRGRVHRQGVVLRIGVVV